ncbi:MULTISPECIES: LysR family transcriptional regulator [Brevibacterium]|uniref:LysR family transcriptional regulator n=1 Tax=Brevibacterium gallinarum TaxID=2762220 RepID=A0ABR8WX15_9MICO|nr:MULTISPECIES: LysR family transcriptional regulator [Brevibacterium]MBD8021629.1 LysR family transcriptional regulator [Brevibacterium gallinarum]MCT1872593.1 LysR family transcriptional regulator [Brevibacterium luteolum]MCT1890566.1 LysR family transcriptional regulator [Brevibacterium luteolum]MCT1893056.1 LysR family transcriptional regulator [Brevibacterium luteolum]MCT1923848.1 LysR family transcriptional regulator [Brevibacterium luteolum]
MELFQLRAFLAVAGELHFGQAAKKLGMAQPPLSRTIRQLEDDLGTELFYRTTRSVSLSPAGEALVGPAQEILENCAAVEESIRLTTVGDIGRVRFGFAGASSNPLVARLASTTRRLKPGISLELETTTYAAEGLNRLIEGSLDLALVRWTDKPPQITGRPVMIERPVVAVHSGHPLASRKSVTIPDLRDEDFILLPTYPQSAMRDRISSWFLAEGISPRVIQEAPDSWLIAALVGEGVGITITYDSVIASNNHPEITAVPLDVAHEPLKVYLAHRSNDNNPVLSEVLQAADLALPTVS